MVLEYMDRGTAQHLSKEGLLELEGDCLSISEASFGLKTS